MLMPRLLLSFEKAVSRIENLKVHSLVLALYLSFLFFSREVLEQIFYEKYYSIFRLLHHFFFYVVVFLAGTLIISLIGKTDLVKTALVVCSGFTLIVLPPLIDHFIFQRNQPYDYILPREFIKNLCTLFLFTPKAGKGIFIEIMTILVLASLFILIKTRSVLRAFLTGFSLYLLVAISVTPRLYLPLPSMATPLMQQSKHIVYFSFYLGISLVLGIFFLYRINRALPRALLRELSSFRTVHFVLMILLGTYFNKKLSFLGTPDFIFVLISLVLMVILWLSTVLINNFYDLPIDRISNPKRPLVKGDIDPALYLNLGIVLSVLCLCISPALGVVPAALTLVSLLSSSAYSMPPLRLRKRLFSTVFIGWGSSLAFLIGYFNHTRLSQLTINTDVLLMALLIFVALSIGPLTKDIKDYQGDLQQGVRTFFTVFGPEKGKKIVSFLLGFSLLIPLFLFHRLIDILFLVVMAPLISWLFYIRGKLIIAYLGYGIVLCYCVFRLLK